MEVLSDDMARSWQEQGKYILQQWKVAAKIMNK